MEANKQAFKKTEPLSVVVERLKAMTGESSNNAEFAITETRAVPNEFLLQYPRGAYTSARTVNRTAIMDLQGHINRTCDSLKLMKFKNSGSLPVEGNKGESNNVSEENIEETEPNYVTREMVAYRNPEVFKELVIPLLKIGLTKYFEIEEETTWHIKGVSEVKITLIVCYSFKESRPILAAHFTPLHAPSSSKCRVEIYGEPRKLAEVKDSQWIRDRKDLEVSMRPGFNEILLSDSNTHNIYEGLSSNFFVVTYNPDTRLPIVITAPLHSVLEGTIRKIVIMICERDEIDLKFWFPNIDDVVQWEGAFITSTSRLVLPIELVHFRDGRPPIKIPTDNKVVEHIKKEVEKEILNRAYPIM
ncbi:20995_t:CDS:2 [Cetraspora pellucida]|uniref:20995_t:CDS:1 n=1 Tax=Cetraspora pellucida TaxID=1433469 RepID=A0A9N9CAK7_9GLOM|nr:20995_t:CDS:2 [Cetraspora pellucida]